MLFESDSGWHDLWIVLRFSGLVLLVCVLLAAIAGCATNVKPVTVTHEEGTKEQIGKDVGFGLLVEGPDGLKVYRFCDVNNAGSMRYRYVAVSKNGDVAIWGDR